MSGAHSAEERGAAGQVLPEGLGFRVWGLGFRRLGFGV